MEKQLDKIQKELDELEKGLVAHKAKWGRFGDMTEGRAFDLECLTFLWETNYDPASAFVNELRRVHMKVVAGKDEIEDLIHMCYVVYNALLERYIGFP